MYLYSVDSTRAANVTKIWLSLGLLQGCCTIFMSSVAPPPQFSKTTLCACIVYQPDCFPVLKGIPGRTSAVEVKEKQLALEIKQVCAIVYLRQDT